MSVASIRLQPDVEDPLDVRWAETPPALKSVRERKSMPAEKVFAWTESSGTDEELTKPE